MNLLITNANSYKAVVVATFIKHYYPKVRTIGLIKNPKGKILHSKYLDEVILSSSKIGSPDFETEVLEIIENNEINVLIPVDSKEIASWLKLKSKLGKTLDYYSDYETFNLLNDKLLFSKTCASLKIPSPQSYFPHEISGIDKASKYVFKPTKSSSSKGVKYFDNLNELKEYCNSYDLDAYMIQEYFEGEGGGISFFAKDGEIKDFYLHKRLAEYPISGGSSTIRGKFDSDLEARIILDARKLIKHLNWSGFCMLELKFNDKAYTFIEANPRIWGSIKQGLVNGTNYFKEMLGPCEILCPTKDKVTYQSPLVFLSMLGYLMKGDSKMFSNISKIFSAEADISILSDPKGYIGQFLV